MRTSGPVEVVELSSVLAAQDEKFRLKSIGKGIGRTKSWKWDRLTMFRGGLPLPKLCICNPGGQ